jgi:putative copper resistance protein D
LATTGLALLLLLSLAWVGHATMDRGTLRLAHQVNQMVHLLGAGLWLGGLVPLAWFLRRLMRSPDEAWMEVARGLLPRFSQMGYAAVAVIALSGIVNSLLLVGSFTALASTSYGRLLSLKIVLFVVMVGLALFNRLRLLPNFRRRADLAASVAALSRSVLAEQALGLGILAVVAILGTLPPAVHRGAGM